jgi:hypothetical protein
MLVSLFACRSKFFSLVCLHQFELLFFGSLLVELHNFEEKSGSFMLCRPPHSPPLVPSFSTHYKCFWNWLFQRASIPQLYKVQCFGKFVKKVSLESIIIIIVFHIGECRCSTWGIMFLVRQTTSLKNPCRSGSGSFLAESFCFAFAMLCGCFARYSFFFFASCFFPWASLVMIQNLWCTSSRRPRCRRMCFRVPKANFADLFCLQISCRE